MTKPNPTRFSALVNPLYAVASKVGTSTSDYFKQAAIYNLDLENGSSWQDIGQKIKSRILPGTTPNIM